MSIMSLSSGYQKVQPEGYIESLVRPERGYTVQKGILGEYVWLVYHELVPVATGSCRSGSNAAAKAKIIADADDEHITELEAKTRLGLRGLSCNKNRDGEYRVTIKNLPRAKQEDIAYYANDIYDAFLTGIKMAEVYAKQFNRNHQEGED